MVARGAMTREAALVSPKRNLITRSVGVEDAVTPDVSMTRCVVGDVYLLCLGWLIGLRDRRRHCGIGGARRIAVAVMPRFGGRGERCRGQGQHHRAGDSRGRCRREYNVSNKRGTGTNILDTFNRPSYHDRMGARIRAGDGRVDDWHKDDGTGRLDTDKLMDTCCGNGKARKHRMAAGIADRADKSCAKTASTGITNEYTAPFQPFRQTDPRTLHPAPRGRPAPTTSCTRR